MSGLPAPYFQLVFKGVDISSEVDPMAISITYTDHLHGEADEIDVTVHDRDGRWKGAWKPEPGDIMDLTIFDGMGGTLPCGRFELDEPDVSGSRGGDTMVMRGLAAPITQSLRTKNSRPFEDQNLSAIVSQVAGENGLSMEGQVNDLFFKRITQRRERDLEFLTRLAEDTGHYFAVRDKRAIFTSFQSIDGRGPVLTVALGDRQLISYNLKQQTTDTYSQAKVTYLDQDRKEQNTGEAQAPQVKSGDILRIAGERVESDGHAQALAKSRLHLKNRKKLSGSIETVGNTAMLAGNTVQLVGFGQYSGKAVMDSTTHTMVRGGYTSSADLKAPEGQ